jgi:hypothetical protein
LENNGSFVSHTYSSEGLFSVTLVAEDITTGCIDELVLSDYIYTTAGNDPCATNPLVIVFNTTDPTSCGVNNGTITSTVTGGTAPYVYSWSNGQVTSAISGLSGGSYVLTVTDAAGCVATQTVNITTLSSPTVSIEQTYLVFIGPTLFR